MPNPLPTSLAELAQSRDRWLDATLTALTADARCVAAWLAGSFGRGSHDDASDLDLHVVITDAAADLVAKPVQVSAGTTPARAAFFGRFGDPAIVHENHWNAINEGTFTFVRYANLVKVDWQLMLASKALRPAQSKLLFAKRDIAVAAPPPTEDVESRRESLREQTAYFWLMLDSAFKFLLRDDLTALVTHMRIIHDVLNDIERLLRHLPPQFGSSWIGAYRLDALSRAAFKTQIAMYADTMLRMYPRITAETGDSLHPEPGTQIFALLALAQEPVH